MKVCVLGSSSDGNATAIWTKNTGILIDAGFSAKELEKRLGSIGLSPTQLEGIVLSHEHSDHTRGAGVLSRRYEIPVFSNRNTFELSSGLRGVQEKRTFNSHEDFRIGELSITPILVPHDASEPNAFVIRSKEKKVAIATDMGKQTPGFIKQAYNSNLVILDSNYDRRMLLEGAYPPALKVRILSDFGHLSNNAAARTLRQVIGGSTRHVLLAHLSRNNNTPDIAISVANEHLKDFERVSIGLTYPNRCTKIIRI